VADGDFEKEKTVVDVTVPEAVRRRRAAAKERRAASKEQQATEIHEVGLLGQTLEVEEHQIVEVERSKSRVRIPDAETEIG